MNGYDGKIVIGTEINTKQFEAQIKILERKLNDVEASLKMASEDKTLFSTREIEEMEAEAENLRNKIGSLQGDFKKTNKELKQTIIMITHNMEIAAVADRIIKIEDGKIKLQEKGIFNIEVVCK